MRPTTDFRPFTPRPARSLTRTPWHQTKTGRSFALIAVLLGFLFALTALMNAQTAPMPTSYLLRFYTPATNTLLASSALPSAAYSCNIDPNTAYPANQTVATWTDPAVSNRQCRYADPGTGGFVTVPPNVPVEVTIAGCVVIDGAITCGSGTGPDGESVRVAYINRLLPGRPGGFQVRPKQSATLTGTIGPIGPDWSQPAVSTARIANLLGPFGPFQMHVGTGDGRILLPEFGEVLEGQPFSLTVFTKPQ